MSEPQFRLKPGQGLVEITSGISRFEIINLANLETVGGNVTHLPAIRSQAIDFAMVEMLETDDEAIDETLAAQGFDPDTGEWKISFLSDADLEAALDAADEGTEWRHMLAAELDRRFREASRAIHAAAFPPVGTYEKLSGEVIPDHAEDWEGGDR